MSDTSKVIYDFDPNNMPPDLLQAIGLMAMCAAQTESVVQNFIGGVLGIDSLETLALTAHMAAPLKDQAARALIELNGLSPGTVDVVDELLDAIKEAAGKRNVVVHNSLAMNPETGEVFSYRQSARGSLQVSLQPVSVEEIKKDAAALYDAGIHLLQFMLAYDLMPLNRTRSRLPPMDRGKKARASRVEQRHRDREKK